MRGDGEMCTRKREIEQRVERGVERNGKTVRKIGGGVGRHADKGL